VFSLRAGPGWIVMSRSFVPGAVRRPIGTPASAALWAVPRAALAESMLRAGPAHRGLYPSSRRPTLPKVAWRFQTSGAVVASPSIANGVVYVGSADHSTYARRVTDGSLLWEYAIKGAVNSSAAVADVDFDQSFILNKSRVTSRRSAHFRRNRTTERRGAQDDGPRMNADDSIAPPTSRRHHATYRGRQPDQDGRAVG